MKTKKVVCSVLVLLLILPVTLLSTGCARVEHGAPAANLLTEEISSKISRTLKSDFEKLNSTDTVKDVMIFLGGVSEETVTSISETIKKDAADVEAIIEERFRLIDEKRDLREGGADDAALAEIQGRIDELEKKARDTEKERTDLLNQKKRELLSPYYAEFCNTFGLGEPSQISAATLSVTLSFEDGISVSTIAKVAEDSSVLRIKYTNEPLFDEPYRTVLSPKASYWDDALVEGTRFDLSTVSSADAGKLGDYAKYYLDSVSADGPFEYLEFRLECPVNLKDEAKRMKAEAESRVLRINGELDALYEKKSSLVGKGTDEEIAAVNEEIDSLYDELRECQDMYRYPEKMTSEKVWTEVLADFSARHGIELSPRNEGGDCTYYISMYDCSVYISSVDDVKTLMSFIEDGAVAWVSVPPKAVNSSDFYLDRIDGPISYPIDCDINA